MCSWGAWAALPAEAPPTNCLSTLSQPAVHPVKNSQHAAATISKIHLPAQPHPLLQLEVLPGRLQVQGRADLDGVERGGTALVDSGCSRERMVGLLSDKGAGIGPLMTTHKRCN